MKKKILLLGALTALCSSTLTEAQMSQGRASFSETSGSWRSFITTVGQTSTIRAVTSVDDAALIIDVLPNSCQSIFRLMFRLASPSSSSTNDFPANLQIRIDTGTLFKVEGTVESMVMGDETFFLDLKTTENYPAIIDEMRKGEMIRISIGSSSLNQTGYRAFKLNGFGPAYDRVGALCYDAKKR